MTTLLPGGHDAFKYLPRLVEFHENVRHGILVPRWAPDLSSGHGQPFFVMAPPVFYYLGEIGLLLRSGPVVALNVACMLLVAVSAWAMYLLGRHFFGESGGWLGAAAYVYAPYFHVDLFVRHAWAEFAAFAFYPWALLGFARWAREGKKAFLLLGAAGYAGTICCHFPAALTFSAFLAAFAVFLAWHERSWRVLAGQAAGMALGLGLAAFCWMPAMVEKRFTKVAAMRDFFLYSDHFVEPHQFFSTAWGYGVSLPGNADEMPFSPGWSHLALGVLVLGLAWGRLRGHRALLGFFAAAAAVLAFLMTPASHWVWDHVSLLADTFFPWRLLALVALCLALLVAGLGATLPLDTPRSRLTFLAVLALVVVPNVSHVGAERYYTVDLTQFSADAIARRGVLAAILQEYEPLWVETVSDFRDDAVAVLAGSARVAAERPTPILLTADVDAETDALLELTCFDFPGWQARVDGQRVATERAPRTGMLRVRVPAGEHRVEARFCRTPVRWVGEGVSLAAALLFVLGLASGRSRSDA